MDIICRYERERFRAKGLLGLGVAILICVGYLLGSSWAAARWWPEVARRLEGTERWKVFLVGTTVWSALWNLVGNLGMWAVYHVESPLFERYKVNDVPWPWKEDQASWRKLLRKTLVLHLINSLITLPLALVATLILEGWEPPYDLSPSGLPSPLYLGATLLFCMLCEDIGFHLSHRLAHRPPLYHYLHKVHHAYSTSVSLAGEYFHPLDFFMGVLLPGSIGGMVLGKRMHFCSLLAWSLMRSFEGVDGHSGYEFPWSPFRALPLACSATYHDFHHSHNLGNYSSFFTFWDTFFGLNRPFFEHWETRRMKAKTT